VTLLLDRQEPVISSERRDMDVLVEHLHMRAEREKAALVRELHDNLGGYLVAALMDATWTEKNLLDTEGTQLRLRRIIQALRSGIDLKRGLIEGIKPSLLEDIGIFSALRGLIRAKRADADPSSEFLEQFAGAEPQLPPATAIALYRVAQEGLELISGHTSVQRVLVSTTADERFTLQLIDNGIDSEQSARKDRETALWSSMQHRIRRLGGELRISAPCDNELVTTASIPVEIEFRR
jgi:signal transduction histidine kinase